jgi:hypothetical protein
MSAAGTITGGAAGGLPDEPPPTRSSDPTLLPPALQPDSSAARATDPAHLDAAGRPRNFPEFIGIDRSVSAPRRIGHRIERFLSESGLSAANLLRTGVGPSDRVWFGHVADILALDHEDHLLGQVRGVVPHALQPLRDRLGVNPALHLRAVVEHRREQLAKHACI